MADPLTRDIACSCGQLTIRVRGEPIRVSMCHCFACQKRSGSVFAVQARFHHSDVETHGNYSTYTRTGDSGSQIHFQFCPTCAATFRYHLDDNPEIVAIPVGMFSDPAFPTPEYSVYEDRRHHWVKLPPEIEHLD